MGSDYALIGLHSRGDDLALVLSTCAGADVGGVEKEWVSAPIKAMSQ